MHKRILCLGRREGADPSVFNRKCLVHNNSHLTLSIKASVRLFSSYQNDVGMSKSVSGATLLRSFAPGEKTKNVTSVMSDSPDGLNVLHRSERIRLLRS